MKEKDDGAQVDDLVIVANDDRGTARTWARSILSSYGYNYTSTTEVSTSIPRNELESINVSMYWLPPINITLY